AAVVEAHGTAAEARAAVVDARAAADQARAAVAGAHAAMEQARAMMERDRAALDDSRAALDRQHRDQAMGRFTTAVGQLGLGGSERLDVRVGAVYALEQLARESPELHWPVMEVLAAHLRQHARGGARPGRPEPAPLVEVLGTYLRERARGGPRQTGSTEAPPGHRRAADLEAIATVIARRRWESDPADRRLDLREVDLRGVRWAGVHLEGADLSGADLAGAQFKGAADLTGADLSGAHLAGAVLRGADLSGARLDDADVDGADLTEARGLTWAQLELARGVERARLSDDVLDARPVEPEAVD